MMRKLRGFLFALLAATLAGAPAVFVGQAVAEQHLTGEGAPNRIIDFDFAPRQLQATVGDTLSWTNDGDRPHTVTDRGGTFDTGPLAQGETGSVTFEVPGTYYFFCRINPGSMNGVIEVGPGPEEPRVVRVQATDPAREGDELSFSPNELDVQTGTTVVLANVGGKPHTITAEDGSFDTGIVAPGAAEGRFAGTNASLVLNHPGTYPFFCAVHDEVMRGVFRVSGEPVENGPAPPSRAPSSQEVDVVDFAFEPPETSVAPGGTVRWINRGDAPHTATFDDIDLDTANIDPGADAAVVAPAQPGNYSYRCTLHPAQMRGVLVVAAPGAADPTQPDADEAVAVGDGPGDGISFLALLTGAGGAFIGGLGLGAFVLRRPRSEG
jgi:plastocyanin